MGGRGSFLESGGFRIPAQWHTVDFVDGIKVLERKDPKASRSLPDRSNTPGTAYLSYRKDGTFDQLRVFGNDRKPLFDIDYGMHEGEKSLHIHYWKDGDKLKGGSKLHAEDVLYEIYESFFKGVPKL